MTPKDLGKYRYLVVDDDDISRELIGGTLTGIGATHVFLADGAHAAVQMAKQHQPDFILLDIYMPDVDGWTLLIQLRQVLPQAVVIMVTGSHQVADFWHSMEQHADAFCIKPVMPDVMEKTMLNALQNRKSTRK